MGDNNLSLLIDRGDIRTYSATVEDATSTINENFVFPNGLFQCLAVNMFITDVGSPAVDIQEYPGAIRWLSSGSGSVVPRTISTLAPRWSPAKSGSNYYVVQFTPAYPMLMNPGDTIQYVNADIEAGSSLDIIAYVNVSVLR
tara:strand:- start:1054 stop:1479 length:426 start_codon:yes stop_codon:yes gene_type:complete